MELKKVWAQEHSFDVDNQNKYSLHFFASNTKKV